MAQEKSPNLSHSEAARKRYSAITTYLNDDAPDPEEVEAARQAAARARAELGEAYEFVEMWEFATSTRMLADLEVEERLNALIDTLCKRLAMLKAFKSISSTKQPS